MLAFNDKIKILLKRPTFVLFVLAVLLWITVWNFASARAENGGQTIQSVSVSPGSYAVDANNSESWQGGAQALVNELSDQADLANFKLDNSAFLQVGALADHEASTSENSPAPVNVAPSNIDSQSDKAGASQALPKQANELPTQFVTEATSSATKTEGEQPLPTSEIQTPAVPVRGDVAEQPLAKQPRPQLVEHSIVLSDFSLAADRQSGVISNVQLRVSLAAKQAGAKDQLKLFYNMGNGWQDIGILDVKDELSNQTNKGFFLFAMPAFASWADLKNLQIKLSFLGDAKESAADIYLDAAWLEIDYQAAAGSEVLLAAPVGSTTPGSASDVLTAEQDFELNQISPDSNFKTGDNPDFNFVYKRKHRGLKGFFQGLLGSVIDEYSGLEVKAELQDSQEQPSPMGVQVDYLANGEFKVRVNKNSRQMRPGKYKIAIMINDGGQIYKQYQDFSWGVLAVNTSKSIYLPTETAYLQMGVLDDKGDTLCDADVFMEITAPDGGVAYLDTYNKLIVRNPLCGPNNVIDTPDYYTHYGLAGTGVYKIKLTARTKNGDRTIYDQFEVRDTVSFQIERVGPTRIWPIADYKMQFNIVASSSANSFSEFIPANFAIRSNEVKINDILLKEGSDYEFRGASDGSDGTEITWRHLQIKAGDQLAISYTFDAPDISPEFYFLGPAKMGDFTEARQWQIASDAVLAIDATAGTTAGTWTGTAGGAWDQVNNTYATRAVVGAGCLPDERLSYIESTANNASSYGGVITKVEIGVKGYVSNTQASALLVPILNGTATGSEYMIPGTTLTTADLGATYYVDITAASSSWTWANIQNLDVMVYGTSTRGTCATRNLNIDQIRFQVTYTPSPPTRPTGLVNSVVQKTDGSGVVDFSATFNDVNNDNTHAKVEYVANANCNFTGQILTPSLATSGITATFGTTTIDNNNTYQLGTTTNWIWTASGTDTVTWDWNSKTDLNNIESTYCVRVTANDMVSGDQLVPATSTVVIDNKNPSVPGTPILATTSLGNEVKLTFGAFSVDGNFSEYKIFYAKGNGEPTEADSVFSKTDDANLATSSLNGANSVLIGNLDAKTSYTFAIWAYDRFGNKASSSAATIVTDKALLARANTVYFPAGEYSGTGLSGANTDTDQRLGAFDFSLAEAGAKIKNAYIVFETRFEAYINDPNNYTGYKLAFDACQKPCSPNAFAGTGGGNIYKYDTSTLAFHSSIGNAASNARLILDVTKEAEMAAYSGSSTQLSAQVGYRLERGGATSSIAFARAMLVVTYKHYDSQDTNYTNTVVYPLESTVVTDSGSKRALQGVACTTGPSGTCPRFAYSMNIPEYKSRLSQWYETFNEYRGGILTNIGDVAVFVDVFGNYTPSTLSYIHEGVLGSGQGAMPAVYFDNVPGFIENTAQTIEYSSTGGTNGYYAIGGEVAETYIASSSAAVKTRTVSFPMGVVSNGGNAQGIGSTLVYLPENGAATGTVAIKKAWLRIIPNYYNNAAAQQIQVATKVGSRATTSPTANYAYRMSQLTTKPSFNIIHVIPATDYPEIENANALSPIKVLAGVTNNIAAAGGTAVELVLTYTYTDESKGHLATLNIFGGQTAIFDSSATTSALQMILPEPPGTKTMLASELLSSFLFSTSSGNLTSGALFLTDVNVSTGTPVCTNAFNTRADGINEFLEYSKDITSALSVNDGNSVYACYSNNFASAKANGQLIYTYKWEAPASLFNQHDWRWFATDTSVDPTLPLAATNTAFSNVNLGDALRLRMSVDIAAENLASLSQAFDLQYSTTTAACTSTANWYDLGTSTANADWRSATTSGLADGTITGSALLNAANIFESYEDTNPTILNPRAINSGQTGEWDWSIYDYNASSSQNYCFRMVKSDGSVLASYGSYPQIVTAASNTPPRSPAGLQQSKFSTTTNIDVLGGWTNESTVLLTASTTDVNINQSLRLFFQATTSGNFILATTVPANACAYGAAWATCGSKIWSATSSVGDYRVTPFGTTTMITGLPQNNTTGYKWQVLGCDNFNACSAWSSTGTPLTLANFYVDTSSPSAPAAMSWVASSGVSITLKLSTTTEANFLTYKIFYKANSTTSPTEKDSVWTDVNFTNILFNGATTTTINNLVASTPYVFNIWAYDKAGNVASSALNIATTVPTWNPPTLATATISQLIDGSGSIRTSIIADDPDHNNTLRIKVEYEAGGSCAFSTSNKPYISTTTVFATYGAPQVDNLQAYQVGTSTGYIWTSPGANTVTFDWLSKINIGAATGTYCMRYTANDGGFDSVVPVKKAFYVDTLPPSPPGKLSTTTPTANSITLKFSPQHSTDDNPPAYGNPTIHAYRIFYSLTQPVTESDMELTDSNLLSYDFNSAATTTISGLASNTVYYLNIWAYDNFGNKSSSTMISVKTDAYPTQPTASNQYKANGSTVINNGSWTNQNTVNLVASTTDSDPNEVLTLFYELIASSSSFTMATTVPFNACTSTVDYINCSAHVWQASSSGNFSVTPFTATATIANLPENTLATGYKWQVLACDQAGMCSDWQQFNVSAPNFRVDSVAPLLTGNALVWSSQTSVAATFTLATTAVETNFDHYELHYSFASPVTLNDASSSDNNFNFLNYNGATLTTVQNLQPASTTYFNLWVFDKAGNMASSSIVSTTLNPMQGTPGVLFYAKASSTLYYRTWASSTGWSAEKLGPSMGVNNIRHIAVLSSDDSGKVAVVAKTWDGTNQQWWGTVYKVAANSFATTSQLGSPFASALGISNLTGCLASLSGGQFFVVRNNGSVANPPMNLYTWDAAGGWATSSMTIAPTTLNFYGGCRLVRRPQTDNYLLMMYSSQPRTHSVYYTGGATYTDGAWVKYFAQSTANESSVDNYVGSAFFDPNLNTRGSLSYTNSNTTAYVYANKFAVTNSDYSGIPASTSPQTAPWSWISDVIHGEFGVDKALTGQAYYAGRDTSGWLNVYRLDITNAIPTWATTGNGINISSGSLYSHVNFAQKPFDIEFYKNFSGLVAWNSAAPTNPKYRLLNSQNNALDAINSNVPGSATSTWNRVSLIRDPNEIQVLAVYQSTSSNYATIFFNGSKDQFFTSPTPQRWTDVASSTGIFNVNDSATAFSYTALNSAPNSPSNLAQFKSNGTTSIVNGGWTNQSTTTMRLSAKDPDTSEIISLYVQVVDSGATFNASSTVPTGLCATTTFYNSCASKIWFVASSTLGDYSATPFTATATIAGLPESSSTVPGFKWQVIACDKSGACSAWQTFNDTVPNFRVDTINPTNPGNLTVAGVSSNAVTLAYGSMATDTNFSTYKIFYKQSVSGVTESDSSWLDANLGFRNYNGSFSTVVTGLASGLPYVFRIWAYDAAGNSLASALEVSTTTNNPAILNQTSYVFENDDGSTVNVNSTSTQASTTLTNVMRGERLNVRIQLENAGGDVANKTYRLEYESSANPNSWYPVGTPDGLGINRLDISAGLSGNSGDAVTSTKSIANGKAWTNGRWYQNTNQSAIISLPNNYYTELVFAVAAAPTIATGTTYRLRLWNLTDSSVLDSYVNYPRLTTVNTDNLNRLSKNAQASLFGSKNDLTYYLDHKGYNDTFLNDNVNRDSLVTNNNYGVFNFVTKTATNSQAINALWDGQSTVDFGTAPIYLQVYRAGTTNAWVTVASNTASAANADIALMGTINSKLAEYYDGSNYTFWRIYQNTGTETLKTDYATTTFSAPVAEVFQKHYRFFADDGGEATSTAMASEDTATTTAKGVVVRLRMSAVNLGGGMAQNYQYQLEYSTTSAGCAYDVGSWRAVPTTTDKTLEFRMATTSRFVDQASTTQRLANTEGYIFGALTTAAAGHMVSSSTNKTLNNTLAEGYYAENEYAVIASTSAVAGATYCFRMTNNGTPLNNYTLNGNNNFAELTIAGNANNGPVFTVSPVDNGLSSFFPVDIGTIVTFAGTATDTEGDQYYLAICKTAGITPGNNTWPSCTGGAWCTSTPASSSVEATCDYVTATTSETANWVAYACDQRLGAGVARCSTSTTGYNANDLDSPFYINHPPVLTSISTYAPTTSPGELYTINTVSSDPDVLNGPDTLNFIVCRTNSASPAGCTNLDQVCASSSGGANISCSFVPPVPSAAATVNYYGFLFDQHGLQASASPLSSSYTISNTAPVLGTLSFVGLPIINGSSSISLNLKGTDTPVSVTVSMSDLNGCNDITSATAKVYMSSTTSSCAANNNNCYAATSPVNCVKTNCLAGSATANYTCTVNMKYYAISTDSYNASSSQYDWRSSINVFDSAVNLSFATSTGVEVVSNLGIDVTEPVIDFGSYLFAGQNSGSRNSTSTIVNIGNSPLDVDLSGTDMYAAIGSPIAVNNLQWKLNSNFSYGTGFSLSSVATTVPASIVKATSTTDSWKRFLWGVGVPPSSNPTAYFGSTTFSALYSGSGW